MSIPLARSRRRALPVRIGDRLIGGDAPVLVQSMTTTLATDLPATLAQCRELAEAGCGLIRVTAPSVAAAQALGPLRQALDAAGHGGLPLCADVHFQPRAAYAALEHVEKVRINPGNFADRPIADWNAYDDADFAADRQRAAATAGAFFAAAAERGRAVRIGVNHGSLSDRMTLRHGNTPAGMVAAALEYCDFAEAVGHRELVISIKASQPGVMVTTVRELVAALEARGIPYPLHLGVTEAGSGLEGRVAGAVGIGALIADGIGDTLRVSLTEPPLAELAPARTLAGLLAAPGGSADTGSAAAWTQTPARRGGPLALGEVVLGGGHPPAVLASTPDADLDPAQLETVRIRPGAALIPDVPVQLADLRDTDDLRALCSALRAAPHPLLIGLGDTGTCPPVQAYRALTAAILTGAAHHALLLHDTDPDPVVCAARLGALLLDGAGDAIWLPGVPQPGPTAFAILQAAGARITRARIV
ncbi:MAG: flavodoxin-dependent (E)-4-hydroxy-3-methylbut-2-enyl-diphosphate synthase, partial [Planctomycetota bacterium]